ncbi:hypothetical protein N803_13915 [Knoellia subterranea KCTC 19937]|uniref:Uncharacterized protein n=1 Tax=Knoellia subterranea KCTC 19937 TaxID=1385521 RepID=A0A0A0JNH3_9MICO|nr:hypothetical protein N803_13915 [Knoellia subterranea KCTC 19937]
MWGSAAASDRLGSRSNGIRMPVIPACVKNSAHRDHNHAAPTPTEIRVSIVAARCRRLVHAARWKGNAPQTTTGDASVSDSHCQLSNWRAGIIDINSTGSVKTADTVSRCRQMSASWSLADCPVSSIAS